MIASPFSTCAKFPAEMHLYFVLIVTRQVVKIRAEAMRILTSALMTSWRTAYLPFEVVLLPFMEQAGRFVRPPLARVQLSRF